MSIEQKKYEVIIGKDKPREFESFEEAFPYLYKSICRKIDEYSISRATIKDATYIQDSSGKKYYYEAACIEATKRGLFKEGKLVERTSAKPLPISLPNARTLPDSEIR